MNILSFSKPKKKPASSQSALAEIALKAIHDGVVMTDKNGVIQFANPAAAVMTEFGSPDKTIGLDYGLVIRVESKEGRELSENENPLIQAMTSGQPLENTQVALIASQSEKRIPISISMMPVDGASGNRIITFRNITHELEEEGEQTEFISTASHEMRTPVATIDGYLSLCLNPQTATLDERARGYLTAAQAASKHLGKLFQDLLDVTKLDDGRIRPHFVPVEMVSLVQEIADDYAPRAKEHKLSFNFGSKESSTFSQEHRMNQVVYGFVDIDFMREILDNLIENAIKYTPEGGSVYVNVMGDGDNALINVTDTGMGISADDLTHIFQKFYRADNSDTREIGGTGLGLYLVKQRVEAMGGRVWAESAFGEGSTFYVSLPRISSDEYEKRMIMVNNEKMVQNSKSQPVTQPMQSALKSVAQPVAPVTPPAPVAQPSPQRVAPVAQPVTRPATQPVVQSAAQPAARPTVQPKTQPIVQSSVQPQAPPGQPQPTTRPQPQPIQPQSAIQSQLVQKQINNNLNGEKK